MSRDQKHPCPDCKMCQWCSDDRCRLCLKTGCGQKMSVLEQIALYERLNEENADTRRSAKSEDQSVR